MPERSTLSPKESLRQLHRVYGPLGPAFVAEELNCTLQEAELHLYGPHADQHCWVSLTDLSRFCGASKVHLKRWVRNHHLQSPQRKGQGRGAPLFIHLADARHYLHARSEHPPTMPFYSAEYLPRVTTADLLPDPAPTPAKVVDVDWQLARRAVWPMTTERLAEALYSSRSVQAQHKARRLIQRWETQGRVICFARGLYDLVRPALVLEPERYKRRALPGADIQRLREHHPEVAHWPAGSIAAAWWAYSQLYGGSLLPVADRGEPTWLEYLMVRQLHPEVQDLTLNARYEELCQETAFYRLVPAPVRPGPVQVTVENIEAGLVDFQVLAQATRRKLQLQG